MSLRRPGKVACFKKRVQSQVLSYIYISSHHDSQQLVPNSSCPYEDKDISLSQVYALHNIYLDAHMYLNMTAAGKEQARPINFRYL